MKILAISGSSRQSSTNTALLRGLSVLASPQHSVLVFDGVADLSVFSPDMETKPLPESVLHFFELVRDCDGIIIASPEYVRTIPGGLKNAIDWLVSRDEIVGKPIALAHTSHRGEDMLAHLRLVLSTISERFNPNIFLRFELMKKSPDEVSGFLELCENNARAQKYLVDFAKFIASQPKL